MSVSYASHHEHLCMSVLDTTHKGLTITGPRLTKFCCVVGAIQPRKTFVYSGVQPLVVRQDHVFCMFCSTAPY